MGDRLGRVVAIAGSQMSVGLEVTSSPRTRSELARWSRYAAVRSTSSERWQAQAPDLGFVISLGAIASNESNLDRSGSVTAVSFER